jgi:hypothetical protein
VTTRRKALPGVPIWGARQARSYSSRASAAFTSQAVSNDWHPKQSQTAAAEGNRALLTSRGSFLQMTGRAWLPLFSNNRLRIHL